MKTKITVLLLLVALFLCSCSNMNVTSLNETVIIPENGIITKQELKKIKDSNSITVFKGNSNGFEYTFTVFGKDIKEPLDINLNVNIQKQDNYFISFESTEDFGFSPIFQLCLPDAGNITDAVLKNDEITDINVFGINGNYISLRFPNCFGEYEIELYSTDKPLVQNNAENKKCTVSIECSAIFSRIEELKPEKLELLPSDTFLLQNIEVDIEDSDTALSVLEKICKENKISLDTQFSTTYNTTYVKGIGNIYELDCGDTSGWGFKVNGEYPLYSCDQYTVNSGDKIVFCYF